MDWKNKLMSLHYRQGFDRFYFVLTLVWFFTMYFTFFSETLSSEVNLYANNPVETSLVQVLVLIVPFITYIILILAFEIISWIINGFREAGATTPRVSVKIFVGEDSFFHLVKRYQVLVLGIIITLILVGIFISFTFTSYNSYEEKRDSRSELQPNFGNLPLPKPLPLPKIYIPVSER